MGVSNVKKVSTQKKDQSPVEIDLFSNNYTKILVSWIYIIWIIRNNCVNSHI